MTVLLLSLQLIAIADVLSVHLLHLLNKCILNIRQLPMLRDKANGYGPYPLAG